MLFQNSPTLENLVVRLLHHSKEGLTAAAIRENVGRSWKPYSRRGIYKELQRLEREGIVMRSGGRYTLRLAWLLSLHGEVDDMLAAASSPALLRNFLPTRGNDLRITCSDLVRWDRIWTQFMLTLHSALPKLPMFIWTPRHWYLLTHPEMEETFTRANELSRNLRYLIVGGRGVLDKRDRPNIARKSTGYSFRVSPFEHNRSSYVSVIGDYLIESSLDRRTAQRIDEIYENTKKLSDLPPDTRRRLLSQKCRGVIRCRFSPKVAARCRQRFVKFFGLRLRKNGELAEIRRGEL